MVVDERKGVAVDDLPHLVKKREGEAQIDAAYLVEPAELLRGKGDVEGPEVVYNLCGLRSPKNGNEDPLRTLPDPGDGDLRRRSPDLLRYPIDFFRDA